MAKRQFVKRSRKFYDTPTDAVSKKQFNGYTDRHLRVHERQHARIVQLEADVASLKAFWSTRVNQSEEE